uniref:Uncharacterized protein n=1 Tax=Oryza sativa subsp. japonica TaxID=39947 RepID=Q6EQV8_ORYSJ|nr:hypothetical protein [Oryza sativa Japonica Group]BAD28962.1 hypothetical protein [Oryza sativa Japonica Group]
MVLLRVADTEPTEPYSVKPSRWRRLVEELPGDLSEKIVEEARRRFVSGLEFTTFRVKEELPYRHLDPTTVKISGTKDSSLFLPGGGRRPHLAAADSAQQPPPLLPSTPLQKICG